jgi:serine/threonine protein kinase
MATDMPAGNHSSLLEESSVRATPPVISDHELVRRIGRGSYGEVWLASCVVGALRAVKIVYRSRFRDARPYEREFCGILRVEPLSRLYEGLVDILHVGRHEPEGYFYYVMELADDASDAPAFGADFSRHIAEYRPRTLASELKCRGRLSFDECVQLGLALSSALNYLHRHGLIHRDVKPSNILYVGGVPKLGDIGLVGEAGEFASYVGTEGYIPPEGPGTPKADVFSLGKVLYEAATGQDRLDFPLLPPGDGDAVAKARLAELNEVVLQACAPDPRFRYATAEELHADLALLHRGDSVRRQRRKKRRWRIATMALNSGLLLTGFFLGALLSPLVREEISTAGRAKNIRAPLPEQASVDLSEFYNASLADNWLHDFIGNDLAMLPLGWRRFGQAHFEPRGIIQLSGGYTDRKQLFFPDRIEGIPIGRACSKLHFFHGTAWTAHDGEHVGSYIVHYADGRRKEIALRYNDEFRNWWWSPRERVVLNGATLAWFGANGATGLNNHISLYAITWNNPFPNVPISSLDFVSTRSSSCPFLLAVTAE